MFQAVKYEISENLNLIILNVNLISAFVYPDVYGSSPVILVRQLFAVGRQHRGATPFDTAIWIVC